MTDPTAVRVRLAEIEPRLMTGYGLTHADRRWLLDQLRAAWADSERLREIAVFAANTFDNYASGHAMKGTEAGRAKAENNRALATMIRNAIAGAAR